MRAIPLVTKHLFYLLLLLLTVSCNKSPATLSKLPDDAVILAFGDSLTYGTGASRQHAYPSLLASLAARKVINEGIPGEISSDGLKRLPRLLDDYQPALLILIHGGNDMLRKIPSEQTMANLNKMIAEARSRNIAILMLGVPRPQLFLLSSANFYQTIAESQHVLTDLETLPDILGDKSMKSDMIHPNDAGYQQMANSIFNLLREAGAL
jgi:acyl-CoA thioesterase I